MSDHDSRRVTVQLLDFTPNGRRSMERFLLALAARLADRGWRTVHVFSGEPADAFRSELRELDSQYLVTRFPLRRGAVLGLATELRRYRPGVIQTHFLSKFDLGAQALKWLTGARSLVVTDHSSGRAAPRWGLKRLLARLRGALAGRVIDRVVAVSDFVRRRDVEEVFLPAGRVQTILNGVDVDRFAPAGAEAVCGAPLTVAYAGQLIPEKGVALLLRAVHELAEEGGPPLRVRVAGAGPQAGELKAYCARHGLQNVEFLGQIDWVPRLFATADVVVVPSVWEEAFGFTVAEAMACGACVLASDAGGIPEVVGPDGAAGRTFRAGDAADLKRKLAGLIADAALRRRLRHNARERAVEHFSIRRMVDEYVALYEELGGEGHARSGSRGGESPATRGVSDPPYAARTPAAS